MSFFNAGTLNIGYVEHGSPQG
ncbi:MAG: hypothetical protein JWP52_4030, partial [Rhizobacter sp.]|nr:hypothetical protein [Rhizobacter sp.]